MSARDDESRIRRIRERVAYRDPKNPYLTLYYDEVEWPDGRQGRYNRVVEGSGLPGVVVLPLLVAGIGLVQVDRYPIGRRLWEVPRGFGESADPGEDARRELGEETGWTARELIPLGSTFLNTGLLAGRIAVYAARIDESVARTTPDPVETTGVRIVPYAELGSLLAVGELQDAATQAAILLASVHGLISVEPLPST